MSHTPTPWELIAGNEHHGPYVVNGYGGTVCDLYAMSNPTCLSVRNGGTSRPVPFTDAEANAAFIVRAVNAHEAMVEALEALLPSAGWSNYDDDELRREHELGNGKAKKILAARAALKLARGEA